MQSNGNFPTFRIFLGTVVKFVAVLLTYLNAVKKKLCSTGAAMKPSPLLVKINMKQKSVPKH